MGHDKTVTYTPEPGFVIRDGKRFHLPVVVTSPCPQCDTVVSINLDRGGDKYLSYPVIGGWSDLWLEHECDGRIVEWPVRTRLNVSLDVEP